MGLIALLMGRLWSMFVGLLMIALGLIALSLLGMLLLIAGVGVWKIAGLPEDWSWVGVSIAATLGVAIIVVVIHDYYVLNRSVRAKDDQGQLLVTSPTGKDGIVMALFLIPRGIDRVIWGRERTNRGQNS